MVDFNEFFLEKMDILETRWSADFLTRFFPRRQVFLTRAEMRVCIYIISLKEYFSTVQICFK